ETVVIAAVLGSERRAVLRTVLPSVFFAVFEAVWGLVVLRTAFLTGFVFFLATFFPAVAFLAAGFRAAFLLPATFSRPAAPLLAVAFFRVIPLVFLQATTDRSATRRDCHKYL
ncbi:MAG: hypothetical protein KKI02_05450, partial [Planctomycetes bacterium]|nr:hypothetical protein [Planctomycetota bacterium]